MALQGTAPQVPAPCHAMQPRFNRVGHTALLPCACATKSEVVAPFRNFCESNFKTPCKSLLHRILYDWNPVSNDGLGTAHDLRS